MKRILAFFCMLVMLASLLNPGVFAAGAEEIRVLEADVSGLTVTGDTWIDLNGHSIDGVTVTGGTLYCLDSQTADYTVADGNYGRVTNISGAVEAAEGYLAVEEGGLSFHRVNLDIYAMTLRADDVGVYYKSYFEADEVVAARVETFGVALSVVAAPTAENLETYCGYSEFTGFEAGEGANTTGTSTLLKGIMKPANGDEKNGKNAHMPIYGSAYIKTAEGYFFGETVERSLRQQVEAVDAKWDELKKTQKAPVRALAEAYASVMGSWNIPNILAPAPLIESEEFTYGSYFDHDRFPGNTGTRLTSGDYGKIRAADALLPAQEITIRVKDADLSNYKVTLGFYTKDGVYTGRTGILPMVDGELTITAGEMRDAYFRVNVYIYNGRFTKVPETAQILVYGEEAPAPEQPVDPEQPADPNRPWEGKKIAVVGDSISTGGYPGTVANLTGATLQNLSVSGSKLSGTGAKSLVSLVKGVAADADLVIVFGGTNDYWHKGTHIGAADATDPNTYVGALRTILQYLKENNPNAKYLFVFPADQTFGGNASTTDFGYGTLQDFRAAFLQFCMENNVHHVDIGATEFDSSKHSGDGVHPNSAGHTIIANAICEKIATGLEGSITITQQQRVLPEVLSVFSESAIAAGNDVEFTAPPYAYQNQTLFAGKRITKIGIPVKRVAALDEDQVFTLSVIKQGSGAYQYVRQYALTISTEGFSSTTVNKWIYLGVDIQLAEDETLAFGGKDDTVIWAWKSGLGGDTYKFRDANGGSTTGIFFDIYAETVLTYEEYQKQLQEERELAQLQAALTGKGISILGDSISTFQGWSNNTSYNSTIGGNYVYYTGSRDGFADVQETWWMQTITRSGLELVVNNSWSGDQVTNNGISRSLQLHNNSGRNPDIIAVYLGINDFRNKVTAETFRAKYDKMIAGMLQKYDAADVYLFTLLYTNNVSSGVNPADVVIFNGIIRETAEKYGCTLVDIYTDTGITSENLETYMGDKALHPNYAGMDLITECFMKALRENYLK